MTVKSLRKQLAAAIAMTLVATVALGSSTYAWFVNNAQVTATGAKVTASTSYSLLISKESTIDGDWQTTKQLAGNSGLTPVSTIGTRLAADMTDMFSYDTTVSADLAAGQGDVRFVASNAWENEKVINYNEVGKNSKTAADTKYYYTDTIYLKAAQASKIALDSNGTGIYWTEADGTTKTFYSFADFVDTTANGNGPQSTGGTDATYDDNLAKAQALVKTLRVGLQVTKITTTAGTLDTATVIAGNRADSTKSGFFVYQLISSNFTVNKTSTDNSDANGVTAAIGPNASETTTIKASGTTKNLTTTANTTLTFSNGSSVPVIGDKMVVGQPTGIASIGSADTLATVVANDVVQVDIYIWMEGCDYDTIAANLSQFNGGNIPGIQFGFCLAN